MARGYVYRPTYSYKGEKRQTAVWYIGYSVNKKKVRESSGSTVKADAEVLLAKRIAESRPGGMLPHERGRVTFEDLTKRLKEDYKRKGNRSRPRLHHLTEHFAGWKATDIDEQAIDAYVGKRLRADAAGATINRELAALRRMLRLAHRARLLDRVPAFDMLGETVREGFIDEDGLRKLLAELPDHLRPLVEALYVSSWRVQDMLSRDWADVDLGEPGGLRIEGSDTKEKAGRTFPMIPRLRAILEAQRERANAIEAETGRTVDAVFFYFERTHNGNRQAGDRIRDFRGAWASACKRAGLPDLRVHDLRRSGIRGFVRAGIGEHLAMKLSGHKTAHVFRRYDILSQRDLDEGGAKLTSYFENGGGKAGQEKVKSRQSAKGKKARK